ncbi:MAG: PAS domain-containing protein, partial [Desulfobacterales bacterium]|nr:PAS domain-containing protein [Desulfobacterales bacterium]
MQTANQLSAETLGQIALIQGMVAHLPDQESILSFVCRGLEIVPGTDKVSYRIFEQKASKEGVHEKAQNAIGCFPLKFRGLVYGDMTFNVSDPDLFTPYVPYIENLSHMLGVIFEERRQRHLKEAYENELEQRVFERTRQLEKEINEHQRSQKLLDSIINNTQNVISVKDLEGRFILVNDQFCEIFKLNRDRIIGSLSTDIFTEDWAAQHMKNDKIVIDKKEPVSFNEYAELPDGRHEYISIKFPISGDTGAIRAVGGISTDITELKDAENALRLDEARLETLLKLFQMTNAG